MAAEEPLVFRYLPLVRREARVLIQRLPRGVADKRNLYDDLVQAGALGLVQAAPRFEAARGLKETTYLHWRIRGAMLDHLRAMDWVPRLARSRGAIVPQWLTLLEAADLAVMCDPAEGIRREDFWREATRAMTPLEQEVIRLYYREGLTLPAIGARLGCSAGAVTKVRDGALGYLRWRARSGSWRVEGEG